MKLLNTTLVFLFLCLFAFGQSKQTTVEITDLKNDKGKIRLSVYNKQQVIVQQIAISIENKTARADLELNDGEEYAISFMHDENSNGKLDGGRFGIPIEGYGFSNDARGFFGPPSFEDQLFMNRSGLSMSLTTKYH